MAQSTSDTGSFGYIQLMQNMSEPIYLIDRQLVTRVLLEVIENLHGSQPFSLFISGSRRKVTIEQMLQRRNLLEFAVALTQNSLIFIIQPVTLLLIKQWHGLCIELAVVYGVYYVPQHGEDNVLACGEDSVCFILCPCLLFPFFYLFTYCSFPIFVCLSLLDHLRG